MDARELLNLQEAYLDIYASEEISEDVQIAAEYFYEQGLNDDGVAILIEELGLDEFNEWVSEIVEDYTLSEAAKRGGTVLKGAELRRSRAAQTARTAEFSKPSTSGRAARKSYKAASRQQRQSARDSATQRAAASQAPTPRSETPTQTRRGIGGLLKSISDRAREDTKKVRDSLQTASDTKLAQRVRVGIKKGTRAVEKHGAAVGGAAGRAAGTAVGTTLRVGQQLGRSEVGQRLKKGLGDAVKKAVYKEEVEEWVEDLVNEGYDLSDYTWDDMYEIYEAKVESGMSREDKERVRNKRKFGNQAFNQPGQTQTRTDLHKSRRGETKHDVRRWEGIKEQRNFYSAILSYLIDEGYAEDFNSAEGILNSMSDEWFDEIIDEAYQTPRFNRKAYLNKLSKRGGMGTGAPGDPMGYRDPQMAKVGGEFNKRVTAAAKAKKTGQPDTYIDSKRAQSKYRNP